MKRLIPLLLALSFLTAFGQTGLPLYDRLAAQREAYPLERIYVHTDAEDYFQGDRIWLKAYLMDEVDHTPVDSTLYVYAELFDKDGVPMRQVKLLRRQGAFSGWIDIPEDMPAGPAYLRAYSRYMAAAPETAFVKRITIGSGGPEPVPSVAGGSAVETTRTEKGFQASFAVNDPYYLLVLRGMDVVFLGGIGRGRKVFLPDPVLPDGPLEFLVLDRSGKVVASASRSLDRGASWCDLPVTLDKTEYRVGEQVTLTVNPSVLQEGEMLDLSVAVTCRPLIARHFPASIGDYVLGRPSGFDFSRPLSGNPVGPEEKEMTATLSGTVRTELLNRPVKDARIGLISPEAGVLDVRQSGPDGRFRFDGLDFPAGTHYLLKSTDKEGKDRWNLVLDEASYPAFRIPPDPYATALDDTLHVVYADDDSPFGTIALEGAAVTTTIDGPPPTGFNRNADFAITLSQMEERGYTCLHELLREIPGVFIKIDPATQEERAYIRATVSINADVPAAIAVDGIIMDERFDLDIIQMPDVARVDVFKTGQTVIWGARGGGGVISITTKSGDWDTENLRNRETVHKKVMPLGHQRAGDFLSATGYRNRRTVYWNPLLLSDSVTFTLGDTPGTYLVVIEGVTSEGRLIHEERVFTVSQ